jgi:diguanylate cyclase (GGDEF)-like protein
MRRCLSLGLEFRLDLSDLDHVNATLTPRHPREEDLAPSFDVPDSGGEQDIGGHPAEAQPHGTGSLAAGPSLLCGDESTRRRMLDMERHMRPARAALFVVMAATLVVLGPSIGWWPLAPLGAVVAGFLIADRMAPKSSRPEYCFMAAWAFSQLMIGMSVVLTGGPRSLFLPWLAIPAATLSSRFNARGVAAGVIWTGAIMIAVSVGVNPAVIAASPQRLLVPLTLLAGVTILSTALMRSDVKHRAAAAIDPLTGLFNRQTLTLRAAELVEQARVTEMPIAVIIGDLDHFKRANDRHGHLVGDEVLRDIANILRTTLRTFDYIYRYGGEEFVILVPGSGEATALATAERLRVAVAGSQPAGLDMTMSFGVGVSNGHDVAFDDLLIAADRALYCAKADGRDRVHFGHARAAIPLKSPEASLAARAPRQEDGKVDGAEATPASAFAAAQRMFLMGQSLDMQALAGELGVSSATLNGWCGPREQLLGEILGSLSEELLRRAKADHREDSGAGRILAIYHQYVGALVNSRPLQVFLQQETHAALQILTSSEGYVQPRMVRMLHELLREEQEAGTLVPQTDLLNLAYAIVRLTEGFLYQDAVVATEPQVERAVRIVALLLD